MSLNYAVLGFLSFKSLSGYELKKAFDQSVQHFWPADQSQIYRTLSQLMAQGLVEQEVLPREDRLDKKLYHITEDGRSQLHQWLAEPLSERPFREPFLIQIFFSGLLSDEEVLALLQHELELVEARLQIFEAMIANADAYLEASPDRRASFYSYLTLEFGLESDRAFAAWLKDVINRVNQEIYSLKNWSES